MKQTRPAAALVMGILNILAGSVSLLCGLGLAGLGSVASVGMAVLATKEVPVSELAQAQMRYYLMLETAQGFVVLAVGVGLLVAGIGLLYVGRWARALSIVLGALMLADWVGYTVLQEYGEMPALRRWETETARVEGKQPPPNSAAFRVGSRVGLFLKTGPFIAYGAVLVLMMSLPHVRAAFAGQPPGPEDEGGPDPRDGEDGRPPDEGSPDDRGHYPD
jgi:hypothetical protein